MEKQEIAVVADSATCTGFRLSGVQNVFRAEGKEAEKKILDLLEKEEIGIIIVNEKLLEKIDFRLKKRIDRTAKPAIIAVPDKRGESKEGESLKAMIRRAIGIELV